MIRMILTFLLLCATPARSETYVTSQTGGYAGFTSLGLGSTFFDGAYNTAGLVGYVPEFIGGENLWSLTLKNDLRWTTSVGSFDYTPIYGGFNLILSFDRDTFWKLPGKYPENYYPPSGLFYAPMVGTELRYGKHSAYFELTSLDYYLEAYVRNSDYLTLADIFTYGVGYKYYLE